MTADEILKEAESGKLLTVKEKLFEDSDDVSRQSLSPSKYPKSYDRVHIEESTASDEEQLKQALFLPYHKPGEYNLLYAPSNAYMFIKFFHALYERLSYAKILVREKIEADLAEMSA